MKKVIFIVIVLCLMLSGSDAKEVTSSDAVRRIEPTVTTEEADVLNKAAVLAKSKLDQAITMIKPFINRQSSAALDFALGNFYFQANKLEDSEKAYRNALKKMPTFHRATANLVRIMIQQDRLGEAKKALQTLLLDGTQNPSILTLTGYIYLLKGEAISAESAYRQALLLDSDDQNAYLGLAKALLIQKRHAEAEQLLVELLEKYPGKGEIWLHLANTRIAQNNISEAITALECARRLQLATAESLATLGDLYLNSHQPGDAVFIYQEAFKHKAAPFFRMSRAIEGFIMIDDTSRAKILLKQAALKLKKDGTAIQPSSNKLLMFEAQIAFLEKNYRSALKTYNRLLAKEPLNGKVLLATGDVYKKMGDANHALLLYERAARLDDVKVKALIRQAQIQVEWEKYHRAVQLLENAQMLDPQPHIERYLKQVRYLVR